MRIYTDLDNVLINPVLDPITGAVVEIIPRPDVEWFLEMLARQGELWLLTAAQDYHAESALAIIGPASENITGIISAQDLYPVSRQVEMIFDAQGLSDEDRAQLANEIPPIMPPGVIFDDYPVGSGMFWMKSSAVGIGPERWIQVEAFSDESPDRGGLRKAFEEFEARFLRNPAMEGRLKR